MPLLRLYTAASAPATGGPSHHRLPSPAGLLRTRHERCVYVQSSQPLCADARRRLHWLLQQSAEGDQPTTSEGTSLHERDGEREHSFVFEIGPRLTHCTPLSTNAVAICRALGIDDVTRLEVARRYQLITDRPLPEATKRQIISATHDRMTECCYESPLQSFGAAVTPLPWQQVDVLGSGRQALQDVNEQLGLAFDDWDLDFYTQLFAEKLRRNPTTVECFDLAQSNSEHSRHWFFKGCLVIDGVRMEKCLLDMVMDTQKYSAPNNVIKFSDNSSAITGRRVAALRAQSADAPSRLSVCASTRHVIFTAETHNFPTGVEPFSGATTGTGGRIRDVQAVGRGGHVIAGTAGYCVGQLLIPDYPLAWEDDSVAYPTQFASPLHVLLAASDGASDYGNKLGEPVVAGFTRSFYMPTAEGRREWVKPIMFSGGIGTLEAHLVDKMAPEKGMLVAKLGGPVYRIGVGGGAASSVQVQGDSADQRDFAAVQRGDAEMGQKLNRVIRACAEAADNPILSIHDQGAGGNGNVLKELVEPAGAVIYTEEFQLGDSSVSALELWGAEYQESNAVLCSAASRDRLTAICRREQCPVSFVGTVTGDRRVVLREGRMDSDASPAGRDPVDLDLDLVLAKMPQKEFHSTSAASALVPLRLPTGLRVREALSRVLRLPAVASKRYLTNKVDRSVTGLVAQQQCVGPFHTPLADVAVIALSHYDTVGAATAIGEQPVKTLLDAAAGGRLSVAEALTNLVFAPVSALQDVKCSGNWMWPAKLAGEAAAVHRACVAACDAMRRLGVAVDGGKDSLSMAARVGGTTVKAPGSLVVSAYVTCPDIRRVVTPALRSSGGAGRLLHVSVGRRRSRLGGSALAQCFAQLGDDVPDLDEPHTLSQAFKVTQKLIQLGVLLAGHDVSDGGLMACVLEMAVASGRGLQLSWTAADDVKATADEDVMASDVIAELFAEEPGWVLEVDQADVDRVIQYYEDVGAACRLLGAVTDGSTVAGDATVSVVLDGARVLETTVEEVTRQWEETSYRLELLQVTPSCAEEEWAEMGRRMGPVYKLPTGFDAAELVITAPVPGAPLVAVIREEGSNGDREMAVALDMAGFQVWDVTMTDLRSGAICLDRFRGVTFPGGFSYADVLGSAVGWAGAIRHDRALAGQFAAFRRRTDTFSLGVCNGCQLLTLLGWIADDTDTDTAHGDDAAAVRLVENTSGRFESRFSTVRVPAETVATLLAPLRGARLGVWTAHGQGRFQFGSAERLRRLRRRRLVALEYTDDAGVVTERYPHNPNGSAGGVAGLCSADGRHLALMPHPERCVLPWQWPQPPPPTPQDTQMAPWFAMFAAAFKWCSGEHGSAY